jgi:hypothetical protein
VPAGNHSPCCCLLSGVADMLRCCCFQGFYYANGVALSPDESYLVMAETDRIRLLKYWLKGPQVTIITCLVLSELNIQFMKSEEFFKEVLEEVYKFCLVMAETDRICLLKYWLKGPQVRNLLHVTSNVLFVGCYSAVTDESYPMRASYRLCILPDHGNSTWRELM